MFPSILGLFLLAGSPAAPAVRDTVRLPHPRTSGGMPLAEALERRQSLRAFTRRTLTWDQIGQLLWAAQGITHDGGKRTAPSAGATYPLELYVATADGLFRYEPDRHELVVLQARDVRQDVRRASGGQDAAAAPALFIVTGVPARTSPRYGTRATRYVQMEAGHAVQNLLLQAAALGLGAVPIGAFSDADLHRVLAASPGEVPLYIVPIGHPR